MVYLRCAEEGGERMGKRVKVLAVLLAMVMMFGTGCSGDSGKYEIRKAATPTVTPTKDPNAFEIPPGIDPSLLPGILMSPYSTVLTPGATKPTPGGGATVTPGQSGTTRRISSKGYTYKEIEEYFEEVALHAEYGTNDNLLHKWEEPIVLYVDGNPTAQDVEVLDEIMYRMNAVEGFPGIRETRTEEAANLVIHFADDKEYKKITPQNITDNTDGFASCWWQDSVIFKAVIGIRTSMPQRERNSVIWEEIVQSMGLQNDSYKYPDSLFYQGYNEVQGPNTLDWLLFEILYHKDMRPGMNRATCAAMIAAMLE